MTELASKQCVNVQADLFYAKFCSYFMYYVNPFMLSVRYVGPSKTM